MESSETTTETPSTPSDNKPTDTKKPPLFRRSARVRQHDPIVAPGFGTAKDLKKLGKDLGLSLEAVQTLMRSRGRGLKASDEDTAAAAGSSAWADFMQEQGATDVFSWQADDKKKENDDKKEAKGSATAADASSDAQREYDLPLVATVQKKLKRSGGILVQTGTLDSSVVGRSKLPKVARVYDLTIPTVLPMKTPIVKVFTAGHAVHSVCIDIHGKAYGWGRNEHDCLTAALPKPVVPTPTVLTTQSVESAAVGKSHTVLLLANRQDLLAVGLNKSGQCGIKSSTEQVANFRNCVVQRPQDDDTVDLVQIACGEDFSLLLDNEGRLYSTGSSEFGQLGNGETGEYFVAANKLGFANCMSFERRSTFCRNPEDTLYDTSRKKKSALPLSEDIRIAHIACGKHHSVAVEAKEAGDSSKGARVFTWGCGDYGCLGHGIQDDEYLPRVVSTLPTGVAVDAVVSAGTHCSLLQTTAGHVYYWGKHRSVGEATMRPQLVDALANNQHVVNHARAGGQTVVCSTAAGATVAWGAGPHGELGLANAKSSSKPQFVETLNGKKVMDLSCGYGHTLFVVEDDDQDDAKLPELDPTSTEELLLLEAKPEGTSKKR